MGRRGRAGAVAAPAASEHGGGLAGSTSPGVTAEPPNDAVTPGAFRAALSRESVAAASMEFARARAGWALTAAALQYTHLPNVLQELLLSGYRLGEGIARQDAPWRPCEDRWDCVQELREHCQRAFVAFCYDLFLFFYDKQNYRLMILLPRLRTRASALPIEVVRRLYVFLVPRRSWTVPYPLCTRVAGYDGPQPFLTRQMVSLALVDEMEELVGWLRKLAEKHSALLRSAASLRRRSSMALNVLDPLLHLCIVDDINAVPVMTFSNDRSVTIKVGRV